LLKGKTLSKKIKRGKLEQRLKGKELTRGNSSGFHTYQGEKKHGNNSSPGYRGETVKHYEVGS